MLPFPLVNALNDAISQAQDYLVRHQAADGHWVGELEADTTITAEYLLLCHLIDRVNRSQERKAVKYLRRRQCPDGGWNLFQAGPTDLSATIKAYFAMKMAGVSPADPAMVRARKIPASRAGEIQAGDVVCTQPVP